MAQQVFPPSPLDVPTDTGSGDAELVARTMRGDPEAFAELFDRHAARVAALAYQFVGDREEAEDITQDAFLQALSALPTLRQPGAFGPWVARIAANSSLTFLRRRGRLPQAELSEAVTATVTDPARWTSPEAMGVAAEEQRSVRATLVRLAPSHRVALAMREIGGLSYNEMAQALGTTPGGVEALLFRARSRFRDEYQKVSLGASAVTTTSCTHARRALAALADDELAEPERVEVVAHVRACGQCTATIQAQRDARRLLLALPVVLPASLKEAVLSKGAATIAAHAAAAAAGGAAASSAAAGMATSTAATGVASGASAAATGSAAGAATSGAAISGAAAGGAAATGAAAIGGAAATGIAAGTGAAVGAGVATAGGVAGVAAAVTTIVSAVGPAGVAATAAAVVIAGAVVAGVVTHTGTRPTHHSPNYKHPTPAAGLPPLSSPYAGSAAGGSYVAIAPSRLYSTARQIGAHGTPSPTFATPAAIVSAATSVRTRRAYSAQSPAGHGGAANSGLLGPTPAGAGVTPATVAALNQPPSPNASSTSGVLGFMSTSPAAAWPTTTPGAATTSTPAAAPVTVVAPYIMPVTTATPDATASPTQTVAGGVGSLALTIPNAGATVTPDSGSQSPTSATVPPDASQTPTPTETAAAATTMVNINAVSTMTPTQTVPAIAVVPTSTLSSTASSLPTPASTDTPTDVPTPTESPSMADALANSLTGTPVVSDTPTDTTAPSDTATDTPSETATNGPTDTPSVTASATDAPANSPTDGVGPAVTPSDTATDIPTATDTLTDTPALTETPTYAPSATGTPTDAPTATDTPTDVPAATATPSPTETPTASPTDSSVPPSNTPSDTATSTVSPTSSPTATDTPTTTETPIGVAPSATDTPGATATATPSATASAVATFAQMRIHPSVAEPGNAVTAFGSGFGARESISMVAYCVTLGAADCGFVPVWTGQTSTDSTGTFTMTGGIPYYAPAGQFVVVAQDAASKQFASASLSITAGIALQLSITPDQGPGSTLATISGQGFNQNASPNHTIQIRYLCYPVECDGSKLLGQATVGQNGSFTLTTYMPRAGIPGPHFIFAWDAADRRMAATVYNVTPETFASMARGALVYRTNANDERHDFVG